MYSRKTQEFDFSPKSQWMWAAMSPNPFDLLQKVKRVQSSLALLVEDVPVPCSLLLLAVICSPVFSATIAFHASVTRCTSTRYQAGCSEHRWDVAYRTAPWHWNKNRRLFGVERLGAPRLPPLVNVGCLNQTTRCKSFWNAHTFLLLEYLIRRSRSSLTCRNPWRNGKGPRPAKVRSAKRR